MGCFLFGGTKGGVGKSTMACNAAAWLAEDSGQAVGLLDTDVQRHAVSWARLRLDEANVPPVRGAVAYGAEGVLNVGRDMAASFAHLVIDAGGRDSPELRAAMQVADVLVMPYCPSQFDLYSVRDMARLIVEVRQFNPDIRPLAFINRASTNWISTDAEKARTAIATVLPCASTIVHLRKAFSTSVETGRAVFEVGRRGEPAASEFTSLWLEVEGEA